MVIPLFKALVHKLSTDVSGHDHTAVSVNVNQEAKALTRIDR